MTHKLIKEQYLHLECVPLVEAKYNQWYYSKVNDTCIQQGRNGTGEGNNGWHIIEEEGIKFEPVLSVDDYRDLIPVILTINIKVGLT